MKIAYLIAAHTDPIQLSRLIKSLDIKGSTFFFIHIDKKVNIEIFKKEIIADNIIYIKKRIKTYWGGFSQCKYQIALIDECIKSNIPFDRVFFLSGLDYPLWSNNEIVKFLENNKDKELIMGMNLTSCFYPAKMQTRVQLFHYRDIPFANSSTRRITYGLIREFIRHIGIKKRNYIYSNKKRYNIYCGSSWWCLTSECVKYIYEFIKENKAVTNYFKSCLAPDELLIQTIIFNSNYASKAILYQGDYPGLIGLTPLHYIEYTDKIATYTEKDFNKLISSGKMFCRKVQTNISDKLIKQIDYHRDKIGNKY